MHGAGNDFIVVDGRAEHRDWPGLAKALCDRHFGVGADGVLVVAPSSAADFRMRMFNPDGSEAEMCGNGIRCFAQYVVEEGLSSNGHAGLTVETLAGLHHLTLNSAGGCVRSVRVGMGKPILKPGDIPVAAEGEGPLLDYPLNVDGAMIAVTCVSMGNPHAVAFIDTPVALWPLDQIGPKIEHHDFFPRRVNFEIVNVLDRQRLSARVWERGAGLTLACGSGVCAIAVAARLKGLIDDRVEIGLPGGALSIEWDGAGELWLEGPTELVFRGVWSGAGLQDTA